MFLFGHREEKSDNYSKKQQNQAYNNYLQTF